MYFHYNVNYLKNTFCLTITLRARDFYEVIVDEAEIESEQSNCFRRILTDSTLNNGFKLLFDT